MSNTKLLLTAFAVVAATTGGAACSCQGNGTGNRPQSTAAILITCSPATLELPPQRRGDFLCTATMGVGGAVVGGYTINAALSNGCSSTLPTGFGTTADDGTTFLQVMAGTKTESCEVKFTGEQADPTFATLNVDNRHGGTLLVRTGFAGNLRQARIETRIHDGRSSCDERWAQLQDLPRGLPQPVQTISNPQNSTDARFTQLPANARYIATVVLKNALDRPIAYGCGGPATVVAGRDTLINVRVLPLAPTVQGKYRFGQPLDLLGFMDPNTDAYRGLKTTYNILKNPAHGIAYGIVLADSPVNGLCKLIGGPLAPTQNANGTWTVPPLCNTGAVALDALLTAGLSAAGDLAISIKNTLSYTATMLAMPKFGGYLEIKTYNQTTKEWTGEYRFDSFNFTWELGTSWCKDNPDPCCAHRVFEGEDLGLVALTAAVKGKAEPDTTVPAGSDVSYKFTMDEQRLSLAIGQIVKALLEQALLPAIMPDDCEGANASDPKKCFPGREGGITLGELVSGLAYGTNCNSDSFCQSMKGVIDALLTTVAAGANWGGSDENSFRQSMDGFLRDNDSDGVLDELSAQVKSIPDFGSDDPPTSTASIVGRLQGRDCTGDTGTDNGTSKFCNAPTTGSNDPYAANLQLACRFAQDPIDGCFARNYCGVPEGPRRGAENCIADNECASGTCMKRPVGATLGYTNAQVDKCFKACKTTNDCGTEGTCLEDGYVFSRGEGLNMETTTTGTCVRM